MNEVLKQAADMMNGRQYRDETDEEIVEFLKENRLVAIYGASDDIVMFEGMINDEWYPGGNGEVYLTKGGPIEDPATYDRFGKEYTTFFCRWASEGFSWTYDLDLDHETFIIKEEDGLYCRGAVIKWDDLPKGYPIV